MNQTTIHRSSVFVVYFKSWDIIASFYYWCCIQWLILAFQINYITIFITDTFWPCFKVGHNLQTLWLVLTERKQCVLFNMFASLNHIVCPAKDVATVLYQTSCMLNGRAILSSSQNVTVYERMSEVLDRKTIWGSWTCKKLKYINT